MNRATRACLGAAVFTAIAGAQAFAADKISFPYVPPKVGMVIRFADAGAKDPNRKITAVHTVQRVDGDKVVYRNRAVSSTDGTVSINQNYSYRGMFTYRVHRLGVGVILDDIDHSALSKLWPLTVGKTLTMRAKRYVGEGRTLKAAWEKARHLRTIDRHWKILRRETITVPAGRFDTLVMERRWEWYDTAGKLTEKGRRLYWFAPKLGWIVKLDFRVTEGDAKGHTNVIEAVSVANGR